MTEAATAISALRAEHEALAAFVAGLDEPDLLRRSGAADWTVADVLSHIGSGSEINRAGLVAAAEGSPAPTRDGNQAVWDRWNAMTPAEQRTAFLAASAALVEAYESLLPRAAEVQITLAYIPFPLTLAQAGRLRLNELALHSWDVRVASDPAAALTGRTAAALLHGEPDLIGWLGKTESLGGTHELVRVTTTDPADVFVLDLAEKVQVRHDDTAAASTVELPAESWLRLVAGRLGPAHTPASVTGSGPMTLDRLRVVFPGY